MVYFCRYRDSASALDLFKIDYLNVLLRVFHDCLYLQSIITIIDFANISKTFFKENIF